MAGFSREYAIPTALAAAIGVWAITMGLAAEEEPRLLARSDTIELYGVCRPFRSSFERFKAQGYKLNVGVTVDGPQFMARAPEAKIKSNSLSLGFRETHGTPETVGVFTARAAAQLSENTATTPLGERVEGSMTCPSYIPGELLRMFTFAS